MCYVVICNKCKKSTWAGCGAHIEQALINIPKENRCICLPSNSKSS